jgi:HSP20 family protein
MANLIRRGLSPIQSLQREMEDLLDDLDMPRAFRREMDRLFEDISSPRTLWRDMDRLLEEFASPPSLRRRVERLFDRLGGLTIPIGRGAEAFVPQVDLVEQDREYVMKADLPGVLEKDIDVSIDKDNVLTVRGERREEERKRGRGYEYTERSHGSFSRSVSLPAGVDASKVTADFHDGVLEIHIPKTEQPPAQKIPIGRQQPKVIGPSNGPRAQQSEQQAQTSAER